MLQFNTTADLSKKLQLHVEMSLDEPSLHPQIFRREWSL